MVWEYRGSIMENVGNFKEFLRKYNEDVDRKRRMVEDKIRERLKVSRIEAKGKWFLDVLRGKRVVGVDGSQISPLRELGIPIGVVQVAKIWVVHGTGKYGKSYITSFVRLEDNIDIRRFQLEIGMLMEEMDGESWLFFDGSLMVSDDETIEVVRRALKMSEETETPLIGYVDKSFSKDVARMFGLDIYDSLLLSGMMDVFSYTQPLEKEKLCYSYVMVNPTMPVRIEYPAWMKDMHEEVVKTVVAECLLGKTRGYPYILERAHHYSCIDAKARASFMKAVKSQGVSFKWMSKIR